MKKRKSNLKNSNQNINSNHINSNQSINSNHINSNQSINSNHINLNQKNSNQSINSNQNSNSNQNKNSFSNSDERESDPVNLLLKNNDYQKGSFKNESYNSKENSNNKIYKYKYLNYVENDEEEEEENNNCRPNNENDKVYLLFINNSFYSQEKNTYFITQQNLYKIIKNISINLNINIIDLIFKRVSTHQSLLINYEQFQQFLILLCEKQYPNEFKKNKKEAMKKFLSLLYQKYPYVIQKETNNDKNDLTYYFYNSMEQLFNYEINESQLQIIEKISSSLMEIYEKYFNDGIKNEMYNKKNSLTYLIEFSRDFEIIPYYLNETQISCYYCLLNEKQNRKKILEFTFDDFTKFIIRIGIYAYDKCFKIPYDEITDIGKLLLFLEILNNSKGMNNFSRKLSRPFSQFSLIPDKKVYNDLNKNDNIENNIGNNIDEDFDNNIENNNLIKNNISAFQITFSYFCTHGDKLNCNLMNLSSYIKFLKHCKIYHEVLDTQRKEFNKISNDLKKKNEKKNGVSNRFNNDNIFKTTMEKNYIKKITKIVNSNNNDLLIGESDVNIIFSYLTGPRNSNFNEYYQKMLDKNYGISTTIWNNLEKKFNTKAINNKNVNEEEKSHKMLRMDFKTFLLSLKYIARKIYSNLNINNALNKLLINNIIPNLIDKDIKFINTETNLYYFDNLEKNFDDLKNEEFSFCIDKLKQVMNMYYKIYFDTEIIVFNQFFNFYTDFSIFPDLINLFQIKTLFIFLCEKTKIEENINFNSLNEINKEPYINNNLFALSFAITANISNINGENNFILNIVGLIEKMNKSQGVKKCILKNGRTYTKSSDFVSFLESIQKKYLKDLKFIEKGWADKKKKNFLVLNDIFNDNE